MPTSHSLYRSILYRAAEIYDVEVDDVERDIGQNFDPMVRFMAGAMASELEMVYAELDSTERRLQERLAQVLLPEHFHLPSPAHALASAMPKSDELLIDETTLFQTTSEGEEEKPVHFSPLLPARLLPAEIQVIATDSQILDLHARRRIKRSASSEAKEVQRLLIGFSSPSAIEHWQGSSLYFDLIGKGTFESERTLFYSAMAKADFAYHGRPLSHIKGLGRNEVSIEDHLNGDHGLESSIRARYDHHFVTFTQADLPSVSPEPVDGFLEKWFSDADKDDEALKDSLAKTVEAQKEPLYWLEIHLKQPIAISQIGSRLRMAFNVFPVLNRRLCGHESGEHHYLSSNAVRWIPLQPEDGFLAIREVYEEGSAEGTVYRFKPFSQFTEEKQASYTLRFGGVGRWDDYNSWKRLAYIVNILREEYKSDELVEAAASALSIEEVHQLLGRKIDKSASETRPTKDIYVLLHSGHRSGVRVRVEYWTSIGEEGNGINAKTSLECRSAHKTSLEKESIHLITASSDGRDALGPVERLDAMKSTLLSRGRIVTREDVKVYCREQLGAKLQEVDVRDGVGSDPRTDFGMCRMLEVVLTPSRAAKEADWDGLCRQLQVLIAKKSTAHIPVNVVTTTMLATS